MKECSKCRIMREDSYFSPRPNRPTELSSHCKSCRAEYARRARAKFKLNPRRHLEFKKCSKCGIIRQWDQFHKRPTNVDGLSGSCNVCRKEEGRYERYGLTPSSYEFLLQEQNRKCAICGSTSSKTNLFKDLCVDHDHKTGKVRGLLCHKCNAGLGHFEDNPEALRKAIEYLREHRNAKVITALPSSLPSVGLLEAADCAS